jgi:hypothetical protein
MHSFEQWLGLAGEGWRRHNRSANLHPALVLIGASDQAAAIA